MPEGVVISLLVLAVIFLGLTVMSLRKRIEALEHARHYHQDVYLLRAEGDVRIDEDELGGESDNSR